MYYRCSATHWYVAPTGMWHPLVCGTHWYVPPTGMCHPLVCATYWYVPPTGMCHPLVSHLLVCATHWYVPPTGMWHWGPTTTLVLSNRMTWPDADITVGKMKEILQTVSFQPVLHDWFNKGRGMYYPVCGMVHIKKPLLLIGRSSPCGSEWFFTICPTPYNRK